MKKYFITVFVPLYFMIIQFIYKFSILAMSVKEILYIADGMKNFIIFQALSISIGFLLLSVILNTNIVSVASVIFALLSILAIILDLNFGITILPSLILVYVFNNLYSDDFSINKNKWYIVMISILISLSVTLNLVMIKFNMFRLNRSDSKFVKSIIVYFVLFVLFFAVVITVYSIMDKKGVLINKALLISFLVIMLLYFVFSVCATIRSINLLSSIFGGSFILNVRFSNLAIYITFFIFAIIYSFIKFKNKSCKTEENLL